VPQSLDSATLEKQKKNHTELAQNPDYSSTIKNSIVIAFGRVTSVENQKKSLCRSLNRIK
jgi:hypothetical protein